MVSVLRYGSRSELTLDVPSASLVAECALPRGEPLDDPAAAVAASLLDPLDFPSLKRCVVPGDRVTVALDPGLPQLPALVAGIVDTLLESGIEPEQITLLGTADDTRALRGDPREALSAAVAGAVTLVTHDPSRRSELRYLAASATGKPIYLNRMILDADLVLPVGCARLDVAPGYQGVQGGMFPTFSDEQTLRRFWTPADDLRQVQRLREEADEVAWLLGISLAVQVIPAAAGQVLHILSGEVGEVLQRSRSLCEQAWRHRVPRRANLVVAAIDGDQREQTWQNVARALAVASGIVLEGGAIALCTDLAIAPGPALRRLVDAVDSDAARRSVRRQHTADALPAAQLLQTLDRAKVYLLSRLDEEVVEELGVAPVSDGSQIARLSGQFGTCILLSSAQYALATPESESDA